MIDFIMIEEDSQKAPSAKRCIKTYYPTTAMGRTKHTVRKHRAPKGALRLGDGDTGVTHFDESESTERQKVH